MGSCSIRTGSSIKRGLDTRDKPTGRKGHMRAQQEEGQEEAKEVKGNPAAESSQGTLSEAEWGSI